MSNHGGNIYKIEREFGVKKEEIIDFSSNINPLGVNKRFVKLLRKNTGDVARYPDPDYPDLKNKTASFYEINPDFTIHGNGATEILSLYFRITSPKTALVVSPSFLEYERSLSIAGARTAYFRLTENSGFNPDIENLTAEIRKGYDVIVVCNPNNPTGTAIKAADIGKILLETKKTGAALFIDESFMDFVDGRSSYSAKKFIDEFPGLFILKSLTKFFALPGLRLGLGICSDTALLEKMKAAIDPWSINCFADLAGKVIFDDPGYVKKTIELVSRQREFIFDAIYKNKNLKIFPSVCNFHLVKILNGMTVPGLQSELLKDNILIRDCSNFKFLDDKFFRIAVKDKKENEFIVKKLSKYLS
jgi:threonine-phosphate decarboxylase